MGKGLENGENCENESLFRSSPYASLSNSGKDVSVAGAVGSGFLFGRMLTPGVLGGSVIMPIHSRPVLREALEQDPLPTASTDRWTKLFSSANQSAGIMDERYLMIVLRLFHIVGGVLWVGSVAALAWFVVPARAVLGESAGKFMLELMERRKLSRYIGITMGLTVLSGFVMYGRLASVSDGAFASKPYRHGTRCRCSLCAHRSRIWCRRRRQVGTEDRGSLQVRSGTVELRRPMRSVRKSLRFRHERHGH